MERAKPLERGKGSVLVAGGGIAGMAAGMHLTERVCAIVCPNKATLQKTYEHKQLMAAVDMALS